MNSSDGMLRVLASTGPDEKLADKLKLFGQFVGAWDVAITYHEPGGSERRIEGEWHFGWVLEGRCIQDVWIAPRRSLRDPAAPPGEYGTTLRFYDPAIEAWRSTWIGPVRTVVLPFIARAVGDEIVLEGSFEPGVTTRWIFSEIASDAFRWRAVESRDGWQTQQLKQEMRARRQPADAGDGAPPAPVREKTAS